MFTTSCEALASTDFSLFPSITLGASFFMVFFLGIDVDEKNISRLLYFCLVSHFVYMGGGGGVSLCSHKILDFIGKSL